MLTATIPDEVAIRHTCHCDTAVEVPADGAPDEHVFTVDGVAFPYVISERGPIVTRLRDNLYTVDVEIFHYNKATNGFLSFSFRGESGGLGPVPYIPVIDGEDFPWLLTEDCCHLTFGHKMIPQLRVAFFARTVTGNCPVVDQRSTADVFCAGGELIANAIRVMGDEGWLESNVVAS